MNTNKDNRATQMAGDQQLADGLTKNAGILGTFGFGGKQLNPADVVQVLQGRITKAKATVSARANLTAAVTSADDEIRSTRALVKAVKQALRALFANDIATLATFGLSPNKVPARKPATLVDAAAKARATRAARGTKGSKQRLTVKADAAPQGDAATATPPAAATPPAPATKPQA
jgi:hypothetical protein